MDLKEIPSQKKDIKPSVPTWDGLRDGSFSKTKTSSLQGKLNSRWYTFKSPEYKNEKNEPIQTWKEAKIISRGNRTIEYTAKSLGYLITDSAWFKANNPDTYMLLATDPDFLPYMKEDLTQLANVARQMDQGRFLDILGKYGDVNGRKLESCFSEHLVCPSKDAFEALLISIQKKVKPYLEEKKKSIPSTSDDISRLKRLHREELQTRQGYQYMHFERDPLAHVLRKQLEMFYE